VSSPVVGSIVNDQSANPLTSSYYNDPGTTLSTDGVYYSAPSGGTNTTLPAGAIPTPADSVPVLNGVNPQSMQRPVLEQLQNLPAGSTFYRPVNGPSGNLQTSVSPGPSDSNSAGNVIVPIRQAWNYSPVKLASYTTIEQPSSKVADAAETEVRGTWQNKNAATKKTSVNSDWKSVSW
jgi:hypothetical protein